MGPSGRGVCFPAEGVEPTGPPSAGLVLLVRACADRRATGMDFRYQFRGITAGVLPTREIGARLPATRAACGTPTPACGRMLAREGRGSPPGTATAALNRDPLIAEPSQGAQHCPRAIPIPPPVALHAGPWHVLRPSPGVMPQKRGWRWGHDRRQANLGGGQQCAGRR